MRQESQKEFEPTPYDRWLLEIFEDQLFNPKPEHNEIDKSKPGGLRMDVPGDQSDKTINPCSK